MSDQFEQVALWKCESCGGENICGHHRCQGCGVKDYGTPPDTFTRTDDLVEALEGLAEKFMAIASDSAAWGLKEADHSFRRAATDLRHLISKLKGGEDG